MKQAPKKYGGLSRGITSYILFGGLLLLLCLPDIAINIIENKEVNMLTGFLFVSSFFLVPILFIHRHFKIYAVIIACLTFFSLLAAIPVFYFGLIFNESVMQMVYNTNFQEAHELFRNFIWPIIIVLVLYLILVSIIIKYIPKAIPKNWSRLISLMSLIILLIIPIIKYGFTPYGRNIRVTAYGYYPFYIMYYGHRFLEDLKLEREHPEFVKDFRFHAVQKDICKKRQIYVLIIGESSRYDHWEINGYRRKTSPKLNTETNLLSYKDVCAVGGITELSVPMLVTPTYPQNYMQHVYEKSIVSLFQEAGFGTWWISNQIDRGNIMMFAKEAEHTVLLQTIPTARNGLHYDMQLIDSMKTAINRNKGNLFIVVHTLGSHFDYTCRYPSKFDVFRPSGRNSGIKPFDKALKQEYINGYDNSILYSDAVIDSAIHLIDHKNQVSALYYISDHGENLYDDQRDLFAHANNVPSKYIAHIPLFIWTSNTYNLLFPKKVMALKKHLNTPVDGEDTFNTLADLGGISFDHQDLTKSLSSPEFKDTTQWILGADRKIYRYASLK